LVGFEIVVFEMYSRQHFCVFKMYNPATGWEKSKRVVDCFSAIMAEISGR